MPERSPDNYLQANTDIPADRLCIHDTALIAGSAQLQATVPYCIEIGAGVVVGEGCWLQACSGDIIIESGTVLGVGVLIVGWSKIGALAIIGSGVTLFETAIESGAAIAAHSVHGLPTRDLPPPSSVAEDSTETGTEASNEVDNLPDPWDESPSSAEIQGGTSPEQTQPIEPKPKPNPANSTPPPPVNLGTTIQPQTSPGSNTPLQIHIPSTSTPFIRSWKRPSTDEHPESSPSVNRSEPPAVDDRPSPQADNQANEIIDETIAELSPDEPQRDDPAIEQIIEETTITKSITQMTNVYGRQHVNRIIDSILRRNTPET